jgi:hypothetical protein
MIGDHEMAASFFGREGRLGAVLTLRRTLPTTARREHTL